MELLEHPANLHLKNTSYLNCLSKPYVQGSSCHHCRTDLSPPTGSFLYTGVQRSGRSEKNLILCSLPILHHFLHFPGFTSTTLTQIYYFCIFFKDDTSDAETWDWWRSLSVVTGESGNQRDCSLRTPAATLHEIVISFNIQSCLPLSISWLILR